jgi:predicted nucleic acid-binding protein
MFHLQVARWVGSLPKEVELATCSITELGFVRVLAQAPQYRISIDHGRAILRKLKANQTRRFRFISDGLGVERLPSWVATARQTTDGHLLELAEEHGAKLATLDQGIPGTFRIPKAKA